MCICFADISDVNKFSNACAYNTSASEEQQQQHYSCGRDAHENASSSKLWKRRMWCVLSEWHIHHSGYFDTLSCDATTDDGMMNKCVLRGGDVRKARKMNTKNIPQILCSRKYLWAFDDHMREDAVSKKEWNQHRQNIYRPFSLLHKLRTIWTISLILALSHFTLAKFPRHSNIFHHGIIVIIVIEKLSSPNLLLPPSHCTDDDVKYVVIWMCSTKMSKLAIIIAFNHCVFLFPFKCEILMTI
jgi:hypothetical protein